MKRAALRFLVSALLAAACAPHVSAQQDKLPVDLTPPLPATAEYKAKEWKEFSSAEGRFSVLLPGTPVVAVEPLEGNPEGPKLHRFSVDDGYEFHVFYLDRRESADDPATAKAILDRGRDDALESVQGKLLEEKHITLDGHPGRYHRAEANGFTIRSKSFVVGKRVYNLVFAAKSEGAPANVLRIQDETASKFLDSFKLIPVAVSSFIKLDAAEGEVDRLFREMRERGEPIYSTADESAAPQPDVEGVIKVSKDKVKPGKALSKPQPAYPAVARAARAQGAVVVQIVVDESGRVIAAQAESGHPLLYQAAVLAARQMLFTPTLFEDKPVRASGIVTYNFALQ